MANTLSTPPLSRFGAHTPSLEGLERVIRDLPQAYPRGRPSLKSRKSSSSDFNKPLPRSPPPPLFTPNSGLQVSHQSQSPGTFISRRPSPLSAGLKPPRPFSTISATPSSIIESYANRPEWTPTPRTNTPLLAPHARVSMTPIAQEERLQVFERFTTISPLDSISPSPEKSPPPSVQSIEAKSIEAEASVLMRSADRTESLEYWFDSISANNPNTAIKFQQPAWASDPVMSSEDMAERYRHSIFPSPFTAIMPPASPFDGLVGSQATPTQLTLPPLSQQSSFTIDKVLDEDDILTPTIPPTELPLSPLPWPMTARMSDSNGNSHEDSYRASRIASPKALGYVEPSSPPTAARPPQSLFRAPPQPQVQTQRPSDVSTASSATEEDASQASWEHGDDICVQLVHHADRVSLLDDPSHIASDLRDRAGRPNLQDDEIFGLLLGPIRGESPGQSTSQNQSKAQARGSRVPPIFRGRDLLTAAERQSVLSLTGPAAARAGIGGADADSLSEYEDDSPGARGSTFGSDMQASRFSDDNDEEAGAAKKRRSNTLAHLRKALGHRKTASASSGFSAVSGVGKKANALELVFADSPKQKLSFNEPRSVPGTPPPSQHMKRPRLAQTWDSGTCKLGTAALKLDESVSDMYNTLRRFSFEPIAKRKSQVRKSGLEVGETRPLSKKAPTSSSTTPRTPKTGGFGTGRLPTAYLGDPSSPNRLLTRSDTGPVVARMPVTPESPTPLGWKSSTWGTTGHEDRDESEAMSPGSGGDRTEGWLARRRRRKEEAKREKWRENMKGQIKVVQRESQGVMAVVATRNLAIEGGLL